MIKIYANNFTTLSLGRQGENLARQVVFDIRDLESLYGTGDVEVIYQRPGDELPYPVAVQRDGTLVRWTITATDTEMSDGSGKCELRYYVGETLAKSKIWRTWVESALSTPSETAPPEPEQGWVDQVLAAGAAAMTAANGAKADAGRAAALAAEVAEKAAQTAQDASDAAKAMEAAQTAQRLAEEAQGAAETARTAAEAAQAAAEQSAQQAEESAAVYDNVVADVNQLKQDLTGLQTVVDSKADKTDLAKTNLYLDALYKLNKGQTYDVLEQESEAYSVDVPSGAKYVGIDKVGGKSVVWNQYALPINGSSVNSSANGVTISTTGDGTYKLNGTATANTSFVIDYSKANFLVKDVIKANHKLLISGIPSGCSYLTYRLSVAWYDENLTSFYDNTVFEDKIISPTKDIYSWYASFYIYSGQTVSDLTFRPQIFDLTQMFGAGNEPTIEEFEAMFPADYYPYSEPTIISSQTDRVDVVRADVTISQQITTGFPVLNSAGSVYDYIDLNEGKLHQRVGKVDLGTLTYVNGGSLKMFFSSSIKDVIKKPASNDDIAEIISDSFSPISYNALSFSTVGRICVSKIGSVGIVDGNTYDTANDFKSAMSGVMLYYELAEEIITDITIPTELTDWLTVEVGGSITFHNTDEGKRLLIPNKLSFVRKLDEVTV